ncbi:uncharacterized protein A1O9_12000 [Exophiala aquamarina CBS 119918]|uniref:Zn(2)-C6 fungal-type domain-containing protein n=1 Tax=Exophiala aquamarina CBS 119918 TaxID=1182545 RepID=A0A072P8U4_9EURO|nr:uncharacterized protein A1O9_12000 [Exophiala aquamarina CBS 119918]KEF52010.1 hypothetical protein A1O9_12000 [Exophiala aquamarina CBS 119918]
MSTIPRRKLACRICTRRKVKCDKEIPCDNCVRRGTTSECERAGDDELSAQSSTSVSGHVNDEAAFDTLRRRVIELEATLQQKNAEASKAGRSPTPTADQVVGRVAQDGSSSPSQDSGIEDAVTVLEFLAWGRMKDPDRTILSPEALRVSEQEDGVGVSPDEDLDGTLNPDVNLVPWLQILLPSRRQVYHLVEYHNSCLLWFHGSYLTPTFSEQLDSFYDDHHGNFNSVGLNLQWVALLFSIMAGTITSAPTHEARKWGFEESESRLLSQKWFKAVIISLNAANYTAHHSVNAVQAITTLTNTAHMLGHSNTQSVMLASAIRIAQSLGLHRLDEDARDGEVALETGRRVWQELCTQDWFSTAFSESYSINPLHSISLPPKNCDENLQILPEAEPTITSFCRFLAQVAAIMPALQDAMALSNTLYTKHEAVLVHDKKMRALATARPPFLANTALNENWPCYIPWARQAIAMSSAHKIIMIHRKFLGLSFSNHFFAFTRRTCLAASKTILKEYLANSRDESSPMLWTHQAFSVAACIVIYFDLLHSSSNDQDGADLVEQTIEHLQLCRQKSMIAARGVKVLNALQKQVADRAESRKRPLENARHEASRKRHRGFDAAEFARSFENGSSLPTKPQERQTRVSGLNIHPLRHTDDSQAIGLDESLNLPADMNWIWNMPVNDADGTQTFDSLMSFANHGLGL